MKIHLAALTAAIASLTPVNPPAAQLEAVGTERVVVVPPNELNPHAQPQSPIPLSALRERSASVFGLRLDGLDDRVSDLAARADLMQVRPGLEPDFDRLKILRAAVATALLNLRDPAMGINAGESAVLSAMNELEIAVEGLTGRLDRLERVKVRPVS